MSSESHAKIRVRFFTKYEQYNVSDAPLAVPLKLGRSGLSEIINHLLGFSEDSMTSENKSIAFDFLVNNDLLRTSLHQYLLRNPSVSTESILLIEYMPAVTADENIQSSQFPYWISRLSTIHSTGKDSITFSSSFDGKLHFVRDCELVPNTSVVAHELPIRSLTAFESDKPNNVFVATGSKDCSVGIWSFSDSSQPYFSATHTLAGHASSVESLCMWTETDGRKILLSGDWSGNILGWNIIDPERESIPKKKQKNSLGNSKAVANPVRISSPTFTIKGHSQCVSAVQVIAGNGTAYSSSWDHSMKKWDLDRQDCVSTSVSSKVFTSLDAKTDSSLESVLTSHPDGRLRLWDTRLQSVAQCVATFGSSEDRQWVSQVKWCPFSAEIFCSGDYGGVIRVWDIRASMPLAVVDAHDGKAFCLDWVQNNGQTKVLSGGDDSILKSFHINNYR